MLKILQARLQKYVNCDLPDVQTGFRNGRGKREYIMRNGGLEEVQAGIKISGRNTNNLRYVDDTTLMAENEEELKSLLMKVKDEREKLA